MRLWQSLKDNSSQLQALAAIAALVAALVWVPGKIAGWLKPDLRIVFSADQSALPDPVQRWLGNVGDVVSDLREPEQDEKVPYSLYDAARALRELQKKDHAKALKLSWSRDLLSSLDCVRIRVFNDTDRTINGVRLRLDGARTVWSVGLDANFMDPNVRSAWQAKVAPPERYGTAVVLPELPTLPPRSSATITAYGEVIGAELAATVSGGTFEIVKEVRAEDTGLVSIALHPVKLYWPVFLGLIFVFCGIAVAVETAKQRRQFRLEHEKQLEKRRRSDEMGANAHVFARALLRKGFSDAAVELLRMAVGHYGEKGVELVRDDRELDALWDVDRFRQLIGEPPLEDDEPAVPENDDADPPKN